MLRTLLSRLIEMDNPDAWLHVDGRTDRGWAHDILFGKGPWLEVAFQDQQTVILNLGRKTDAESPAMPASWAQQKKGMWAVRTAEREELIKWMEGFFRLFAGAHTEYRLKGWIEG
jgi:hypothetical protein